MNMGTSYDIMYRFFTIFSPTTYAGNIVKMPQMEKDIEDGFKDCRRAAADALGLMVLMGVEDL